MVRIVELTADKAEEALAVVMQGPWDTGMSRLLKTNMLLPRTLVFFLSASFVIFYVTSSALITFAIGCLLPAAYYVIARSLLLRRHRAYFSEMLSRDEFVAHWIANGRRMWVALDENNGNVIGTIALGHITADVCELFRMSVSTDCRRGGIGHALMFHLLQYATNRGYKVIQLRTLALFTEALALYAKHGFRVVKSSLFAPISFIEIEVMSLEKQLAG